MSHYVVFSREHNGFWTEGFRDVTPDPAKAGRFERARAFTFARSRNGQTPQEPPAELPMPFEDAEMLILGRPALPGGAFPSKLTPEQKEQGKRRIAPLMQTLVDVNRLQLAVMEALAEAGPGGFDPQQMHRRLADGFDQARKRFEIDLGMVKRMLAVEALRAAGHADADGHVRLHAIDQKMVAMETATRALQREARERPDEPSDDLPRPR